MAKWKEFEKLVAQIYKEMTPEAHVVHNDKIQGIDSGILRQIDVSIRFKIGAHEILSIIQAKDYNDPADINVVGEFASVIKDVRANKGILICKGGFTEGAVKLAQNYGIDICNIHDAESRDWSLEIQLPVIWIDLKPTLQVEFKANWEAGDSISKNPLQWHLSSDHGNTKIDVAGTFTRMWNEQLIPRDVGTTHHLDDSNLKIMEIFVLDKDGQKVWRDVKNLIVSYTVSRRAWLGSFSPAECRGVFNYNDDTFTVSYLPIGAIPKERDTSWKEIDNPDELVVTIPGTLITTESWQVDSSTRAFAEANIRRLGDS